MKLELDTVNKTIKLTENILLSDLMITLESLFPDFSWKQYTLITNVIINYNDSIWFNPVIIRPYQAPYQYPWITYDTSIKDFPVQPVYAIDMQLK